MRHPSNLQCEMDRPVQAALVSLAFWGVLLVSTGLFALLVLAPRVQTWDELSEKFVKNDQHYRNLQAETSRLESMAFALEHDPDYARRLAMRDLDLKPARLIQVDPSVAESAPQPDSPATSVIHSLQWGGMRPLVHLFAQPGPQRSWGTWGAAGLCLLAFVCLNDGFFQRGPGKMISDLWKAWARRYQRVKE